MNTTARFRSIVVWVLLAPGLVACGLAAANQDERASDSTKEIRSRFDTFEGLVREIPMEEWDNYFFDSPFSVAFKDGGLEIGSDRFHDRVEGFLDSPESDGLSLGFELHQVWTVAGRLALVRGDVQAKVGRGGPVRPFAELLVKRDGAWRTVASYVGSPWEEDGVVEGVRASGRGVTACACEPCRTCSSRR